MKVLAIFGTRPEAMRMASVVKALGAAPDVDNAVCATAQHRQMLDQVLRVFEIWPDHDLNLIKPRLAKHQRFRTLRESSETISRIVDVAGILGRRRGDM